jgi:gas vesicle protein
MARENGSTGSVLGAFVIGAVAGAAVAVLFAPASGEETRRKLAAKAREGSEKAKEIAGQGREFIERQRENLDAAVERGREVYDQVRKESA